MKITPKKIVKAFIPYGILKILDVKKSKSIRVNAEKLQYNPPSPLVQTDIMQKWLSQIHGLCAAGYTATQWCIDKGYKNVVLYTEKQYWPLIEPIALSFRMDERITTHACSRIPFITRYQDEAIFGWFVSSALNTIDLKDVDVVFIIKPFIDSAAEKYLEGTKTRIVQLPSLIQLLRDYFFLEKPLILFTSLHPYVHLLTYCSPRFPQKNRTENEDNILSNRRAEKEFLDGLKKGIFTTSSYDEFPYTPSDVLEMMCPPPSYLDNTNLRIYNDKEGKYVNIKDGHRITIGQPENPEHTIYFFGGCRIFGHGAPDSGTTSSHLQALLNSHAPERHFIVQNYGGHVYGRHDDRLRKLFSLSVKPGDIVVSEVWAPLSEHYCWTDLSQILQRPHPYGEVFIDGVHFNENGNRAIADALYKTLEEHDFFSAPKENAAPPGTLFALPHLFGIPESVLQSKAAFSTNIPAKHKLFPGYEKQIEEYKKVLYEHRNKTLGENGAIAMTAGPFTYGHRYLVEYAAARVSTLYIFVVKDNKTFLEYEDRYAMVKEGTKDLPNVVVLSSGMFIGSRLTFSSYYNREKLQEVKIDPSSDVIFFAEEIAPILNIKTRFVGTEPFDTVTKQYNETMHKIFPENGVSLVEIPRKEIGGVAISASTVRRLLEEKNFVEISKIVPETTLLYLKEKYSG
ncbi:citrate lyase ligase C- domain protein [Treponema primitia ZAS-2]|uniref:Citrate lyase ligase C-domain protein n=1 Tax=Treponema primitia (strain ATCC BAA-887 / DSM 12427 / ZAS-2) TaxID=545694 RepID=F5YGN5_TREPZ|nr:citrate lyase ligase [Treponema primitia]AEF84754.1 citrate lyase ligase C- domain protein [Treponema primitia ZAS-2]